VQKQPIWLLLEVDMSEQKGMMPGGLPEVRRVWDENEWYYAIVDFIALWTESLDPNEYWRKMKRRADPELKSVISSQIKAFSLKSPDKRMRRTECATRETLLRLVQSVPSKKAEEIRRWLAEVGNQRLEELEQQSAIEQLRESYRKKGYDEAWIETRITDLQARNEITTTWQERGAQQRDYPILTNVLVERTFGLSIKSYKIYKDIPQSAVLPDNMTPQELAFNTLSKTTAQTLHEQRNSQGFEELHRDAINAGDITSRARKMIEQETGVPIVSKKNAKDLRQIAPIKKRQLPPGKKLFD
jgi:hypothetical protein